MCIICDDEPELRCRSLRDVIETVQGNEIAIADMKKNPDIAHPSTWFIIGCRADFQKGSILTINHFQPGWHRKQLGEKNWSKCRSAREKLLMLEEAKLAKEHEELDFRAAQLEPETLVNMRKELDSRAEILKSQANLFTEIEKMNVFTESVPADGNCALWSLLTLGNGSPSSCGKTKRSLNKEDLDNMRLETLTKNKTYGVFFDVCLHFLASKFPHAFWF